MARVAPEKADFRPALPSIPCCRTLPEKIMATFKEQWKDPRWQKKRLEVLDAAGWACNNCGDTGTTLNVHHKRYLKGRSVWDYDNDLLEVLCEPCHEEHHEADRRITELLLVSYRPQIASLIAGFNCQNDNADHTTIGLVHDADPFTFRVGVCAWLATHVSISELGTISRSIASLTPEGTEVREVCKQWFGVQEKG